MIWLYRLAFLPAMALAMPYYAARMLRRGGYGRDFSHRFGLIGRLPPPAAGKVRVWIQAVSVGEVEACAALLKLMAASGRYEAVVTTTTSTGYAVLRKKYAGLCAHVGIFPFDFAPFSSSAWERIRPDLCVLMEGELWPEHIHQAHSRGVPVALLNARLSDRSFSRYSKVPGIARRIFSGIDFIACGSGQDMERFAALGADPARLACTGNIKFDSGPERLLSREERLELRRGMGFADSSLVLLGSSTWEGEEEMLVKIAQSISSEGGADVRLLIVPRHAERRGAVRETLERLGVRFHFRSGSAAAPEGTFAYVGDTTGELRTLTQAADFAFIGKSMPPNSGGQSPLDCAAAGVPFVCGPNMTNFRQMCASLRDAGAFMEASDEAGVRAALAELAGSPGRRAELSKAARAWHASNSGASKRSLEILDALSRRAGNA